MYRSAVSSASSCLLHAHACVTCQRRSQPTNPPTNQPTNRPTDRPTARANKQTQHNTTQHNTTQHNTTQHNTTQHNTTQHNTTQHNTTQHNTTQHNTTQHHNTTGPVTSKIAKAGLMPSCLHGVRCMGMPPTRLKAFRTAVGRCLPGKHAGRATHECDPIHTCRVGPTVAWAEAV